MFYWLIDLSNTVPGLGAFRTFLNVFRYITFRTGGAMVTGALFVFLFGPWIIDHLRLRRPIYRQTAAFGHFGRTEPSFTWEAIDKADELRQEAPVAEAAVR